MNKSKKLNDIFAFAKKASQEIEHELNLKGLTKILCPKCKGKGYSEPGYTDYDSYGEIYRESTPCSKCHGNRQVQIPCKPEQQIKAIESEIEKWQAKKAKIKNGMTNIKKYEIGALYLVEDGDKEIVCLYLGTQKNKLNRLNYKWLVENQTKYSDPMFTNVIKKIKQE